MGDHTEVVNQALALVNAGDSESAITLLDSVLKTRPDHFEALFFKGEALRRAGAFSDAESMFLEAARLVPTNAEVLFRLGLARFAEGRMADAEKAFIAATACNAGHQAAWLYGGLAALQQDHLADAERLLRTASELDPSSVSALANLVICLQRQERAGDALPIIEQIHALDPANEDAARSLFQAYVDAGALDKALTLATAMAARLPRSAWWCGATQGWIHRTLGRLDAAADAYRRAFALEPNSAEHATNLGLTLRQSGNRTEAKTLLERAATLNPGSLEAHFGLANLLLDDGRLDDAEQLVETFEARVHFPRGASRSVVIPILDYSPGSSYNIRTLLDDLHDFNGEVICIFNSEEVFEALRQHPRIDKFSFNKHNVGVSRAWNMGINQAEGETIHILNADLHISVPMLYRLEQWLHSLPDALCVGVSAHWIDPVTLKEIRAINSGTFTSPIETDLVSGQLFSLHAKRLHDAGITFDPRLSPYFGEEPDLALKARQNGLKIYAVPETDFAHSWGISRRDRPIFFFGRQVNRLRGTIRNEILLHRKWNRFNLANKKA
ncbi:tetratricopeptide repeat protein [Telmatospirillum sp.]|uniref:tetratricopeptide repeat protein n=1 Tax=Telmatospirillum sp. TaxID=2079197 RepID=UPI0028461F16|nr:tetratricopeptide repeat protein [Telmatospirillum sp.]MDR3441047.1 tetratricopeptide repeat protein [Telmatospirillum sp.]